MFKELFVVLKAKFSDLFKGLKEVVGVTQGAAKQMNASAKEMEGALTSAFSGQVRDNITNLSENISVTRENIVQLKEQLKLLLIQQKKQKEGTAEFKAFDRQIKSVRKTLFEAQQDLAKYNIEARDQKKALADSRLAAEDNSSAMEATSRAVNAATGAILLLGEGSESLKPVLKGVSVAMAGVNAVIAIQNLKLRENQVFANLTAKAQNTLRSAFVGTTVATTALKSALAGLGIVAAVAAIAYLTSQYNANSTAIQEQLRQYTELRDVRKNILQSTIKESAELSNLKNTLNDNNASLATKKAAYNQLSTLVPELTGYTYEEAVATGVLTTAINLQAQAIQKRATTQAFADAMAKKQLEIFDEQNKTFKESTGLLEKIGYSAQRYLNPLYSLEQDISEEKLFQLNQADKIAKLQQDLSKYQQEYNKAIKEELQIEGKLGGLAKDKDKVKKLKPTNIDFSESLNAQKNIEITEAKINEARALSLATTERKRAEIVTGTEQQILDIRQKYQDLEPRPLTSKAYEEFKQIELDKAKTAEDGLVRLQKIRDKETDDEVKHQEYLSMLNQEAMEGQLGMEEERYTILSAALAKEYNDGLVNLQKYNQNKINAEIAYLEKRREIYKAYGIFATAEELKLAQISISTIKDTETEKQRLLKQTNRVIQQEFQNLFESLAKTYSDAIVAIASGGDPLQTLFNGILMTVASFMESFGKAILSVGIALLKLDVALKSLNPFLAIAGGVALIAAAGVAKSMAQKGVTPFADGGIVSGPTLGLVGEYPGASTNPEVIAPLDKLKSIIGGNGDSGGFIAETRISGRDLSIVLNRFNKDNARG